MERTTWTDERIDDMVERIERSAELVRTEVREMRAEMHAEIHGLRTDMRGEMHGLRTDMHAEIHGLRTEVHGAIHGLRAEMHAEFRDVRGDIASLRRQMITIVLGVNGVLAAALVTLAFARAA